MANQRSLKLLTTPLKIIHKASWMSFIFLAIGGIYLSLITFSEWFSGKILQGYFYQWVFLSHLLVGLVISLPLVYFIVDHFRRGYRRSNRNAVYVGIYLAISALLIIVTGVLLIRLDGFSIEGVLVRQLSYWLHLFIPMLSIYYYIQHRKLGRNIKLGQTQKRLKIAVVISVLVIAFHFIESSLVDSEYEKPFAPANVEVVKNQIITQSDLLIDDYCAECHQDFNDRWQHSAHHFSSLKNPVYEFSIKNTKQALMQRDGISRAANLCASCHDPVPLLTGQFDTEKFNNKNPAARVGVNCIACHSIENINGTIGNGNYQFKLPTHYPFAFSEIKSLKWLSNQLVKAKPNLHKQTFLKPVHKTAEFCSSCHKVSLPYELNKYRWLRGQNHFDEFVLSGFSGSSVSSFYYPEATEANCNGCHLPLIESQDFAAKDFANDGSEMIHDHLFPSANTALHVFEKMPESVLLDRQQELKDILRLDVFGFIPGSNIDGPLLRTQSDRQIELSAGEEYIAEVVIRTTKMGHMLPGGTVDSNEIWLSLELWIDNGDGEQKLAESGAIDPKTGDVDLGAHFITAYLLDKQGNKIEKRNVEDIFVALYNHQIPPGAADVVHYQIKLPKQGWNKIRLKTTLNYRKFTQKLLQLAIPDVAIDAMPITEMATAEVLITHANNKQKSTLKANSEIVPLWMRWNDYGIALLRKPQKRQLKQAAKAFKKVLDLGRVDGAINLTRVYLQEGLIEKARQSLNQAIEMNQVSQNANPWTLLWLKGKIELANGDLLEALSSFEKILKNDYSTDKRQLDFSKDYRFINLIAKTEIDLAILSLNNNPEQSKMWMENSIKYLHKVLTLDSENAQAYFNLSRVYELKGDKEQAGIYRKLHQKYKVDEFARSEAIAIHRKHNPEADHAANSVVLYPLKSYIKDIK
jgi:tetratricopeptide (TPR) repeat protein